jgi:hypothetical protein
MSTCAKIFARNGNVLQLAPDGFKTGHQPIHSSKSGTCVAIDATKDVWYCSNPSCRMGGGSITAIMNLEGKSYAEAEAEVLALGGTPPKRPPRLASLRLGATGKPRAILYNVLEVLTHEACWADILRYN